MRGSLDAPPIVITQSRLRIALIVLCGLAFVALGFSMVRTDHASPTYSLGEIRVIGWVCLVFFGLCTVSGIAQLVRPGDLRLGPDGLEISLFAVRSMRTTHYDWADIDHFDLISVGRGTKMVGWYFSPSYAARTKFGEALLNTAGRKGGLSGTWPLSKKKLLALLQDAQARWAPPPSGRAADPEIPAPLIE